MGIIELFKEIGNRIKSVAKVTFSNQDLVGEDIIENLELAILTTSGVDNKEGSELIKALRDVEREERKKTDKSKSVFGKNKTKSGKGKSGTSISRAAMQDTTMQGIKEGVTTRGKYDKGAVQDKVVRNDEKIQREHDGP